jgi:predicted Zn-dependent protease
MLLIDTQQEIGLGRNMDKELRQQMKFVADPALQRRLDTIGARIARASDRQDVTYHFAVVDDKTLNAFAVPGGFVYIHSGLMRAANDDELAGVIAHEIGHIAARHSVKQIQGLLGTQLILGILTGGSGSGLVKDALSVVSELVNLGYSRKDEYLADELAVRYTRRAGYSPLGIITFFQKLEKEHEKSPSLNLVFLSSHPPMKDRIARIEQLLRE